MNKRLLELALESNLLDSRDDLDHPAFAEIIVSVEKFAELVVRECVDRAFTAGDDVSYLYKRFGITE